MAAAATDRSVGPWLVWGIGTVVLLLTFWIVAYGTGWSPIVDSCVLDDSCYCEWFDLAALQQAELNHKAWFGVQQPVNTYSNLYAIVTSGYVACRMWRDRKDTTKNPANSNMLVSQSYLGEVWVFCVLFLGLGSMWFHGSMSAGFAWLDSCSMFVFAAFLVFYTLDRLLIQKGCSPASRNWTFWVGYPLTVVGFTALSFTKLPSELLIGALVLVYIILEHWVKFIWTQKSAIWWFIGLTSFGTAAFFRAESTHGAHPLTPDAVDWLCWPHSWFQPHGLLWHTLSGVMALCMYIYWREDTGGTGRPAPPIHRDDTGGLRWG